MLRIKEKRLLHRDLGLARSELERLRQSLEQSYCVFNSTSDPELLEASILEISALRPVTARRCAISKAWTVI